ncbi:hypothetical protein [Aeromonas cavernicola]|uniref:Uncharacterized protein n=1 Tax=Aeromonas cavernicola TaxID=1006623 RepID=A0A2H9U0K6_9GAMM|nr:hypothetical protein [Aeromonas cavernicola]PJG57585.1 hypothetical protein CUC53_17245 [Aeromonas cavernicola]
MQIRSEQMADYIADRLEFITFLACCSALLALLTGMTGQQALAFTALNMPLGLAMLLMMALVSPLPAYWRAPCITLFLASAALLALQLGGEWLNPIAVWCVYGLLGLEILWQARPRSLLAADGSR